MNDGHVDGNAAAGLLGAALGIEATMATVTRHARRGGLDAKRGAQQARRRVSVHMAVLHADPPEGPKRSVFTRPGA